jgi:hypothetical protein
LTYAMVADSSCDFPGSLATEGMGGRESTELPLAPAEEPALTRAPISFPLKGLDWEASVQNLRLRENPGSPSSRVLELNSILAVTAGLCFAHRCP